MSSFTCLGENTMLAFTLPVDSFCVISDIQLVGRNSLIAKMCTLMLTYEPPSSWIIDKQWYNVRQLSWLKILAFLFMHLLIFIYPLGCHRSTLDIYFVCTCFSHLSSPIVPHQCQASNWARWYQCCTNCVISTTKCVSVYLKTVCGRHM